MKKHLLPAIVACFTIFSFQNSFAQTMRRCDAVEYRDMEEKLNPSIKAKRAQIEQDIQNYIQNQSSKPNPAPHAVITIPVVFHIIYKTAAQNVSDAIITNSLASFNKDFRKQNADFSTVVPSVFQAKAADCEIQFCLAKQDPGGAATTGITRNQTSIDGFYGVNPATSQYDDRMKFTAQGGCDIWDNTKYINFWVVNFADATLGRGSFPGGPANVDGVIVNYTTLPGVAGANPAYNLGRTNVHELGHYFFLGHLSGDAPPPGCGDDLVADTPTQQYQNTGCPAFPHVTCGNGPNGDLFMDYMDYTNDACMAMFTLGQKTRMLGIINNSRASLLTSNKCSPPGTAVSNLSLNQFVDVYPNPSNGMVNVQWIMDNGNTSTTLEIYNVLGEKVYSTLIINHQPLTIDLSSHLDGMYFVEMKTSEGTITKKVVINK